MAKKKTSSKMTPKIIGGVVVLILLGAAAYFFLVKGKNSPLTGNNPISSVKDMLTASVSMHCEFTDQGKKSKVDIKNGAVRMDYSGATEQETGSIIIKNKKMYLWTGKEGYVYDVPDEKGGSTGEQSGSQPSQKDDFMKSLEQYKNSCRPGVVSDSLFDVPGDVKFNDISKMMQQNGAGAGGQQIPQNYMKQIPSMQDNSGDNSNPKDY